VCEDAGRHATGIAVSATIPVFPGCPVAVCIPSGDSPSAIIAFQVGQDLSEVSVGGVEEPAHLSHGL
jgi:hypothetical protein